MFTNSVTVLVAVSKMGLFFIEHGVNVDGQYCWDVILSQQMLDAVCMSLMTFCVSARQCTGAFNAFQLQQCKTLYLTYGLITFQRLTLLITTFR